MNHWTTKYLGRPYIENSYDCASLFCEVQAEEFDKVVPDYGEHSGLRSQKMQFLQDQLHAHCRKLDEPKEGCGVVMRHGQLWHIGVFTIVNYRPYILHNILGMGTRLTPYETTGALSGFQVEELLEWI